MWTLWNSLFLWANAGIARVARVNARSSVDSMTPDQVVVRRGGGLRNGKERKGEKSPYPFVLGIVETKSGDGENVDGERRPTSSVSRFFKAFPELRRDGKSRQCPERRFRLRSPAEIQKVRDLANGGGCCPPCGSLCAPHILALQLAIHESVTYCSSRAGRAQSLDKAIAFVTDIQGFFDRKSLDKEQKVH